jgi:uncharacterized membrane protein HdeD (DUF308 family)
MGALERTWKLWIVRGIASVLFGVITLVRPGASIAAMVLLFGIYALADGALLLGFAARYAGRKSPYVVRGLISVGAGMLTFIFPGLTALSLYVLIGAWAITAGVAELVIAITIRKEAINVSGLVLAGILSLVCGVGLLVLPVAGVIALLGLIAAYAMLNGVVLIVAGVRIHNLVRPLSAA